jgi:glycosyltransferase involved in cell wall biosynthesis
MTIVHVIPFLWSGAGQAVTRLCVAQRASAEVHVVTSQRSGTLVDWPSYRQRLRRAGVTLHRVDTFNRAAPVFWTAVAQVAELIDALGPDLVHAHAGTPATVCAIARQRAGRSRVPLVAHMYSWGPGRPPWMDSMDTWGMAAADATICSAHAYMGVLRSGGVDARRLHYVPWGVDEPPRRKSSYTVDPHRGALGFIGRIEPRKQQLRLVRAMRDVVRARPETTLDLIGPVADEAYAERIRTEIERLGLARHVRLRGRVASIWPALLGLDLFVSLSDDEGQGLDGPDSPCRTSAPGRSRMLCWVRWTTSAPGDAWPAEHAHSLPRIISGP